MGTGAGGFFCGRGPRDHSDVRVARGGRQVARTFWLWCNVVVVDWVNSEESSTAPVNGETKAISLVEFGRKQISRW